MSNGLEIERKFLVEMPELQKLDVKRRIGITQTYLVRGGNGSQRRVRKISENGKTTYTYTEKQFISPVVRNETEYEIDENEYSRLLMQRDEGCVPIEKVRYCFDYRSQLFELDTYPFSRELAIMELELSSPEQTIELPEDVNVLGEVSGDGRYSNAALANAGAFPEQNR